MLAHETSSLALEDRRPNGKRQHQRLGPLRVVLTDRQHQRSHHGDEDRIHPRSPSCVDMRPPAFCGTPSDYPRRTEADTISIVMSAETGMALVKLSDPEFHSLQA